MAERPLYALPPGADFPAALVAGLRARMADAAPEAMARVTLFVNTGRMARAVEASFPPETKMSRPTGGFVLWLELPKRFDSRTLFDEALKHNICFAPGDVFSASRRFRNCLRLSAGHGWNDHIEDGVRHLGRLAQELLAR